jgi:hypothetical protein
MKLTTTLEADYLANNKKNWYIFLSIQKFIIEQNFSWLKLIIKDDIKALYGTGILNINDKEYHIELYYSPFYEFRYDRIYIKDKSIKYNDKIHLYRDLSLCLYHPIIDKPKQQIIPLYKMIPWITEWIIFYNQWKKYGVWLNKEIRH